MKLLMLSSSRAGDEGYLETACPMIINHLNAITNVLFVPYAGVTIGWDDYTQMVQEALPTLSVTSIHTAANPQLAVEQADAILVGGGNTFHLLHTLYALNLITALKARITAGTPYIGWSAGSNICGHSIRTTNDMPIIEPASFNALNVVPFQLNPHYTDYVAPGHNGETRDQRIAEFCALHADMPVLGIQEGTALEVIDDRMRLVGELAGVVFKGTDKISIQPNADLSHYLKA
ncbi:dipeptidase PepE [Aestuariibacter sp. AA17]|uniref:Dipeptidase PepE n=1 Tax=Fluctibacter corallii TaxID=2984329 RepID=A0ABT3ABJ0_9ALTE|nr:dipeptidase PepE [Aestuariibacter sp. AA17]MCV2885984.1 dipeptidase PepE [Aestuariibacter sp. AA17]